MLFFIAVMGDLLNFEVANFETRFVCGFTSNDVQIRHWLDKASRLSIREVMWTLPSDTAISLFMNRGTAMLTKCDCL